MRESVRITAQREIVVAEKQARVEAADEKVIVGVYKKNFFIKNIILRLI